MDYDLETDKIIAEIKRKKAKLVCLQLPDGLKPQATKLVEEFEEKTKNFKPKPAFYIWAGSNFGGCDYPWYLKDLKFDLLINFGHREFRRNSRKCRSISETERLQSNKENPAGFSYA